MKDKCFLYQHKELLTAKSHTVKKQDLEDLRQNAIDEGLEPVYIIEYQGKRWFMISEPLFEEVREQYVTNTDSIDI